MVVKKKSPLYRGIALTAASALALFGSVAAAIAAGEPCLNYYEGRTGCEPVIDEDITGVCDSGEICTTDYPNMQDGDWYSAVGVCEAIEPVPDPIPDLCPIESMV